MSRCPSAGVTAPKAGAQGSEGLRLALIAGAPAAARAAPAWAALELARQVKAFGAGAGFLVKLLGERHV